MKTLMLKSLIKAPPGGWPYMQPKTKLKIGGPTFEAVANKVLEHRIYKKLDRATRFEVMQDIEMQIIERINGDPNYCTDKNSTNGRRDI